MKLAIFAEVKQGGMSVTHGHCNTRAAIRPGKTLQRNRPQGCILYERVLLDEAEKRSLTEMSIVNGHCKKFGVFFFNREFT